MPTSRLFEPLTLRSITMRNRIGVSPMCQYSCVNGAVNDWHLVHLGSRAVGGAGLVIAEATAVSDVGRISPGDSGIWSDSQVAAWQPITAFIEKHGAVPGIQLAHAGWKASTFEPWRGDGAVTPEQGGWQSIGVGSTPFTEGYPTPRQVSAPDIDLVCEQFRAATKRALTAGFKFIEIHAAHGYLLHSFLSPLSNKRDDQFGGSFENRTRLLLRVAAETRQIVGDALPLAVRLSCSDWTEGGWTIEDSVALTQLLKAQGVDLIDCSSGGATPKAKIPAGPGYQVAFAEAIRKQTGITTATVGFITDARQAETIMRSGQANMVFLARELLRDPYWPAHAARELGIDPTPFTPQQYLRAW